MTSETSTFITEIIKLVERVARVEHSSEDTVNKFAQIIMSSNHNYNMIMQKVAEQDARITELEAVISRKTEHVN